MRSDVFRKSIGIFNIFKVQQSVPGDLVGLAWVLASGVVGWFGSGCPAGQGWGGELHPASASSWVGRLSVDSPSAGDKGHPALPQSGWQNESCGLPWLSVHLCPLVAGRGCVLAKTHYRRAGCLLRRPVPVTDPQGWAACMDRRDPGSASSCLTLPPCSLLRPLISVPWCPKNLDLACPAVPNGGALPRAGVVG